MCVFLCTGMVLEKVSWKLRQSSSGLWSSICLLVLCLFPVYAFKRTYKCSCNLNKNAISELISLLLMPNRASCCVCLYSITVQYYCKKKPQREGEAKMPPCELTAAALTGTLAFNATWQGLHQQHCNTEQESNMQQCRWEMCLWAQIPSMWDLLVSPCSSSFAVLHAWWASGISEHGGRPQRCTAHAWEQGH